LKGRTCFETPQDKRVAEVAVDLPLPKTLHYQIPPFLQKKAGIGKRVLVPVGKRRVTGYVLNLLRESPVPGLKEIIEIIDEAPFFSPEDLRFFQFLSTYYFSKPGNALRLALFEGRGRKHAGDKLSLPALKKERQVRIEEAGLSTFNEKTLERAPRQAEIFTLLKEKGALSWKALKEQFKDVQSALRGLEKKGLVCSFYLDSYREHIPFSDASFDLPPSLTLDQARALKTIREEIRKGIFHPYLLHGVTGSGKTEIYLKVIEEVLEHHKSAIVLVPEISLTSLALERFRSRFGRKIALIHSRMSEGERQDELKRIREGEARIVLGARSALFAPLKDLGAIIVDEEHDPSYKQEEGIRYHARDLALVKGRIFNAVVILGSATPSIESYYNSQTGKLTCLSLPERVRKRPLPQVKVIDLRRKIKDRDDLFSPELREGIEERLKKGEQVLLFLNRRGFATSSLCPECGYLFTCPHCSVSLVQHMKKGRLLCHFCNYQTPLPETCPQCNSLRLKSFGWGTERVEKEVKRLFPGARVARMDRDTTQGKLSYHHILTSFAQGKQDILIGTQMITKGYDIPQITLVGILLADTALSLPDFRASERAFQLLTQVAGRAGRGDKKGEVIIQTFNPEHYSITSACNHDFLGFYKQELHFRQELNYPPFSRIIAFRLEGGEEEAVRNYASHFGQVARGVLRKMGYQNQIDILGPAPAPWAKLKGRYRYQMLLKGKSLKPLHSLVAALLKEKGLSSSTNGVKWSVDVDPIQMM
jgi:primosomal protein N' (replication factor Y)